MATHENLARDQDIKVSRNRDFGWVFTIVFLVVALWPLLSGGAARLWALIVSGALLLITLATPGLLALPNRLWQRFGLLLSRVTTPLVLAVMFYAIVVPTGLLRQRLGNDPLRLRKSPDGSYWITRDPPGPEPGSMSNQF